MSDQIDHVATNRTVVELPAGWSPRFFREGDEEGILRVLNAAFDRWPKGEISVPPIDHLRWKLRSHEVALRRHKVAEIDSNVIAASMRIVRHVKLGGRTLLADTGTDAAVDPACRNLGIMTKVSEFGVGQTPAVFDLYFGLRSGHAAMRSLQRRSTTPWLTTNVDVLARNSAAAAERSEPPAGCSIRDLQRFDRSIREFSDMASSQFDAIAVRSSDYLNWRYCDPRAAAFAVRLAERDGRVLGYVVSRVSYRKGYLADLLVLPGRLDVAAALVGDALISLQRAGAQEIECWCPPGHPYRAVLQRLGFMQTTKSFEILFQVRQENHDFLAPLREHGAVVHFMLGDTDLV